METIFTADNSYLLHTHIHTRTHTDAIQVNDILPHYLRVGGGKRQHLAFDVPYSVYVK